MIINTAPLQSAPKAESQDSGEILVDIRNVKKYFPIQKGLLSRVVGHVKAVDDVSLAIRQGETFGLVGESGCGKSTLGRVILRLQGATDGEVVFRGRDIHKLKGQELRKLREEMQIIFQDPFGSLNPRFLVRDIIGEPLRVHRSMSAKQIDERVVELMELVGLDASRRNRYPHEFSGGQRQRIGIARAIALNPKFIVADEAVSALDVSVQSQVINLLMKLQRELGLTFLFIAHGLNVVRHISDRVGVMYLGKLVEVGETETLFAAPLHPYTAALLSAIPKPAPGRRKERVVLQGDVPSPANPPSGCRFHTRCPFAGDKCAKVEPKLTEAGPGRQVACHFPLGADSGLV
ncbi:MAG: dipeptide ABC transporter ATP-binding protein [Paenibacillus macerans]|uniref:Dipeptide ABC transporter ATP-binding protein n=1 Tax=Paenibacillus macerans TaxID=44252 RepID=A0A6N8EKV2_PAEMA|nr:dipeptide ABC transporter ATP-binding protein [Paenibacillus macerans]MCY7559055.1 dipeptide ABC transporter ATP-binding protein [Paenibacillus macerans]MDU5945581.1 dipeptide ABC transporter ATP-binding protein [Paenibacillus macerans]MDU7472080.1 dipeptide ABC transporter ATP-binding protein [Paenibacillus macerans]MEC0136326.1 dipeptide ABC transporter ATP-binding protein [Paenibacillus macerans]MEC0154158.1 dipeptide ABC transporter ATP-binding protein [Paenibacillus macerans]